MKAWIVDAFADERYQGNPAAVVVCCDGFLPTESMQATALALGMPSTAFVVPGDRGDYDVRWFTPSTELSICGHATIACAAYLYMVEERPSHSELCFRTQSGPLFARFDTGRISLSLPCMELSTCAPIPGLQEAIGARIVRCARATDDIVMELESEDAIASLRPRFDALAAVPCRGHVVTARADGGRADFVSRTFFPALGVDEDQVCVSAHCKLGPYWAGKLNKQHLEAIQLSSRGGRLRLEVGATRVHVTGTAVVRQSILL
jgi:PhzF family phenazine biosynthesis protein